MKKYDVTVEVTLEKVIEVRAESGSKAMDKVVEIINDTDLISPDDMIIKSFDCTVESDDEQCECCDGDCEECDSFSEREFLFEELY